MTEETTHVPGLKEYLQSKINRGDLTVESMPFPSAEHHTAFLLSLPIGEPG